MDAAAEEAKKELLNSIPQDAVERVSTWWAKWFITAGHKRLGRLLVETNKTIKTK